MKRLRKRNRGTPIRFFHCGEYGEKLGRPHYHACLFGFDFKDKYLWSQRNGFALYRSPELEETWGQGHALVGEVTFESAAYVARYITKKVTGDQAVEHYSTVDKSTGEVLNEKRPEYITMSRRPGIARGWFDRYGSDVFPSDFVVVRGVKVRPPKFYDGLFELVDPEGFSKIKAKRVATGKKFAADNTDARLRVKEEVKKSRIKTLVRSMEVGDVN